MISHGTDSLPQDSRERIDAACSALRGATPVGFEWVDLLSPGHQRLFAVELYSALARANITDDMSEITDVLDAWESTAELESAPEVVAQLRSTNKRYREWSET